MRRATTRGAMLAPRGTDTDWASSAARSSSGTQSRHRVGRPNHNWRSSLRRQLTPRAEDTQASHRAGCYRSSSTSGNERCRRGGTRKFWRCVVRSTELKPWPRSRGSNGSFVPSGQHAVHREAVAVEVVARRVEDDEVDARRRRRSPMPSRSGSRAPGERVVERVEVGPVRDRRALAGRPCRRRRRTSCGEPRRRLDRRAVADLLRCARSRARTFALGRHVARALRARSASPRRRPSARAGTPSSTRSRKSKLRYQASRSSEMCETCMCVPLAEVAALRVGVAERLEVRDPRRAEAGLLRRGEAEEELGRRRGSGRRPARSAASAICFGRLVPAVEAAAREAAADARRRGRGRASSKSAFERRRRCARASRCAAARRRRSPRGSSRAGRSGSGRASSSAP